MDEGSLDQLCNLTSRQWEDYINHIVYGDLSWWCNVCSFGIYFEATFTGKQK